MHRGHEVRRDAGRQQRPAARRQRLADHRGDVPRARTSSTRTSPTTTSWPTTADPSGSSRSRRSTASTARSARSQKAAKDAPRPYRFVVLSDHGQSLGATFKQRYGKSLGEVVRDLMCGRATLVQAKTQAEGSTFVNSFLSEITRSKGVGPSVARAALAGRTTDGVVDLDHEEIPPPADAVDDRRRRLGQPRARLVHRPRPSADGRGARGAPSRTSSRRSPTTRASALLMVRSAEHGAVAFGPTGVRYLDEDRVEGEDPTTLFGGTRS